MPNSNLEAMFACETCNPSYSSNPETHWSLASSLRTSLLLLGLQDCQIQRTNAYSFLLTICLCLNSPWNPLILVYLSAQAAITRHHRLGGLKTDIYFLTDLEAGSSRSRCWQGWYMVRPLFLACRWCLFAMSLLGLFSQRERERSGISSLSYKDTSPIRLGPTLITSFNLNYLLKVP